MLVPYATIAAIFASGVFAQSNPDPLINTPVGVTQCETTSLTWSGTHPPWTISISGQINVAPLETIVQSSNDTSDSWLCNLPQGTYITFEIRDSQGTLDYSAPISVLGSSDDSCINGTTPSSSATTPTNTGVSSSSSSSSSISSSSHPTTSGPHTSTLPVSSGSSSVTKGSSSITTSTTSTGTSTSSTSSSTHKSGGAMPTAAGGQWGVAGLLGLVGAAVLA